MPTRLSWILVGDHLGQVKKVLLPTGEISILSGCATPSSSNPVVSIERFGPKHLIANKNGQLFVYDALHNEMKECQSADDNLIKALPFDDYLEGSTNKRRILYVHENQVVLDKQSIITKTKNGGFKRGEIVDAKLNNDKNLAIVGKDIPLRLYDINKKALLFDAEPPERDWLGIKPDVFVAGLDFVGAPNRVATCSKSDSVIRVYDTRAKPKQIISINLDHTAFNEHAESSRFTSVASTGETTGHSIVVGSNVGQMLAIDLRFNIKQGPKKKKLQPRQHKVLGGFKGSRGASIKDIKIIQVSETKTIQDNGDDPEEQEEEECEMEEEEEDNYVKSSSIGHSVVSCSLDRYLRIYNFTRTSRHLNKQVYMTTKPLCCSLESFQDT